MKTDALNAVVTLANHISPWLMVLQVVPDGWTFPDFAPGQYVTIGLPVGAVRCNLAEPESVEADPAHIIRRAYCIASSAANREFLEFFIHLVPHGALTPRLFALKIGDRVSLTDRVTGAFTFDHVPEDANVVLIATGTGLAPYVSMISTHLRFGTQRRVALVHGVRNSWDLGYRSILMTMQHLRTNVTYLPVVSRPADEPTPWNGATGHVQEVWKGRAVEEAWGRRPTPEDTHLFLSGSPHMIDDMAALLAEEGFREHSDRGPGQIHIERYWVASPTRSHGDQTATLDLSARRREPVASGTAKETTGVTSAKDGGHDMAIQRIAINCGGGYVPGLNGVVVGAALAARRLGWEVVGIHDGYDGLLVPENYPDGGLITFDARAIDGLDAAGSVLGTGARNDPFCVRHVGEEGFVGEVDRSDELLEAIRTKGIDAVISVVGGSALTGQHALSVALKLSRKGLRTVCVPKSIENDIAATALSFGFNSALSAATETLDRIRTASRDVRRLSIVEVPGHEAGWLALQAGIAARADVILIPEIPHDLQAIAAWLKEAEAGGGRPSLLVAAEGARPKAAPTSAEPQPISAMRKSLSPLTDPSLGEGAKMIDRSGRLAESLALSLQRLTEIETLPISLGHLVRGGAPTAVDRQLGLGYGAAAVQALSEGQLDVMVAFHPPDLAFVPLGEAINKVRTIPAQSEFIRIARALGICLGDRGASL